MRIRTAVTVIILAALNATVPMIAAQDGNAQISKRVVVVFNARNRESRNVAAHYMAERAIPARNGCGVKIPDSIADPENVGSETEVPWREYETVIRAPIRKCVETVGRDTVLYIVLTYGMPYRFEPVPQPEWGRAIDEYIADLWDESGGNMHTRNPYFATADTQAKRYQRFTSFADYRRDPRAKRIYSVWRVDGPTARIASGLVDKAIEAERVGLTGLACFDRMLGDIAKLPYAGTAITEWQLHRAAEAAREAGFKVIEDDNAAEFGTAPAPARCDNAALYSGWYALNHYNDAFTWAVGAIGWHLDSNSALPRGGTNWSANALEKGITVTSGAVAEPYLDALPRPDGIMLDLFQGANVGDAFLRNTAYLKWMVINIGDPLYTPFPSGRAPFNTLPKR